MKTTTRTIAGTQITLQAGRRYLAGRPIADGTRRRFAVTISDITEGYGFEKVAARLEVGGYDEANEFIAAFNNGESSFDGRAW